MNAVNMTKHVVSCMLSHLKLKKLTKLRNFLKEIYYCSTSHFKYYIHIRVFICKI